MLILYDQLPELSDQQVAELVNEGNMDAFVELTARYIGLIRGKASAFRGVPIDAEDLYQEGLLGLLHAAHSYRSSGSASFKTYAGVCIYHQMVTACRSALSRKNLPLHNFVSFHDAEQNDCWTTSLMSDQIANPETLLIDRENLEGLRARINQSLSKMEQEVLFLYLNGCTYQEIAQKQVVTVKAVDNAIQRVRKKLKNPF
ncbi:MAG: sigma-70 family RNA polymerase sigma factor [Clostridium sp.]|uniref:sigma-70 family RNA polymerase sigma factor n=1 Tax=Clostridium sp. TaxID=1506 RepID=UPI0029084F76|nr:sigma-70 family RNA polymerase sigma factor [Clostridium sp.]MDU7336970.1 sigma-70 family RNA polymerase sigma factor [Clostridium sp.]